MVLLAEIANAAAAVMLELAPWLLMGAAFAGLLHVMLPDGFVQRQLSGKGGVLKAVVLGIPLPLCSCSVIPTGIGLRRDGASRGASVGFLIATPQTGVDSILVSAGMLGWPFALSKVVAALVTGLIGGWITDALPEDDGVMEPNGTGHNDRSWRAGLEHAVDLIRMIWRWLVFGVLLSAVLTTVLPPSSFQSLAGEGLIAGFVVALLVSLPLYVCATASVPIAAALIHAGLPTGAAMVFLMAGPATNVATIGAVRRAFGTTVTAAYLSVLVVGSVLFGLAYQAVFGTLVVELGAAHLHAQPWAVASAVVLVLMMGWFAVEELRGWSAGVGEQAIELKVEGMSCGGCASRLERTLLATSGVKGASVSIESKVALVDGELDRTALCNVIEEAGFHVVA